VSGAGPGRYVVECDNQESRWPLRALGRCGDHSTAWDLDETDYIMRTNFFYPLLFGTSGPYLQIISPDLSVTVVVTLHGVEMR
jgi:hypothetical protein